MSWVLSASVVSLLDWMTAVKRFDRGSTGSLSHGSVRVDNKQTTKSVLAIHHTLLKEKRSKKKEEKTVTPQVSVVPLQGDRSTESKQR